LSSELSHKVVDLLLVVTAGVAIGVYTGLWSVLGLMLFAWVVWQFQVKVRQAHQNSRQTPHSRHLATGAEAFSAKPRFAPGTRQVIDEPYAAATSHRAPREPMRLLPGNVLAKKP
jgi:hypothetical protein